MKDPTLWVNDSKRHSKKRHEKERLENGFSTYDWWNFNSYLSWVIIGGLKKFLKDGNGYPGGTTKEEWDKDLQTMIEGFEANEALQGFEGYGFNNVTYEEWSKPLEDKWERGIKLFLENYGTLWD